MADSDLDLSDHDENRMSTEAEAAISYNKVYSSELSAFGIIGGGKGI